MSNIELPEATLIDIKRTFKIAQNRISAKFNYSELFNNSEYYFPRKLNSFGCHNYTCSKYLTKNIKKKAFLIACRDFFNERILEKETDKNVPLGIRPVFKYSEIKEYSEVVKELTLGYLLITFGEYPDELSNDEKKAFPHFSSSNPFSSAILYTTDDLKKIETGNVYTHLGIFEGDVRVYDYPEILFEGIDGKYVMKGKNIYKVKPVYFLVDVKKDFAISKDLLFVLPTLKDAREISSYKETLPYEFLNTYFVPELMQNIIKAKELEQSELKENSSIKELIDKILFLSENTCLESIIKKELQELIDEYNNDLDNKKKENTNTIELSLTISKTPETKFLKKLESLYSKIINFPYYKDSKLITSCLNLEKDLESDNELYKDLRTIIKYIIVTLPARLKISYQYQINEILKSAKMLIINLYTSSSNEKINVKQIIREKLQPILESLSKDVATNFININLHEIIEGIFKNSSDKYQSHLFDSINNLVREIEVLIYTNKLEKYPNRLREILSNNSIESYEYLIKLYIELTSLKNEIEEELNHKDSLELQKIRIKIF